jgi:hypothetical protein
VLTIYCNVKAKTIHLSSHQKTLLLARFMAKSTQSAKEIGAMAHRPGSAIPQDASTCIKGILSISHGGCHLPSPGHWHILFGHRTNHRPYLQFTRDQSVYAFAKCFCNESVTLFVTLDIGALVPALDLARR